MDTMKQLSFTKEIMAQSYGQSDIFQMTFQFNQIKTLYSNSYLQVKINLNAPKRMQKKLCETGLHCETILLNRVKKTSMTTLVSF